MLEMIFFPDGIAELWNRADNYCIASGKVGVKESEDGFDPMINFAIALMTHKGDYDPDNPIREGVVELRDNKLDRKAKLRELTRLTQEYGGYDDQDNSSS